MRICFFGESAAAGYLYAPYLTPAKVLQHHLNRGAPHQAFEVIDLARTNERLETLVETVEATMQLGPDQLVIFAGNNWTLLETPYVSPYAPDLNGRRAFAAALAQHGMRGPVELAEATLLPKIDRAFATLQMLVEQHNVPLTVIIPEVNLADWETRQPLPWLDESVSARWYTLYTIAVDAIRNEAWRALLETADEMLTLDGEQCPTSWRLLATAHRGLGNEAQAKLAAQLEVCTTQYATIGFLAAPQISVIEQTFLRQVAERYGFGVVDLPALLPELTGTALPGRTLFADYCHLTAQGMHVAMTAVAAHLLNQPAIDLLTKLAPLRLASEKQALAQLGAAIHTAHRQLPVYPHSDLVRYWCERAIQTSPGVVDAMLAVVEARCTALPVVLTAVQQHNLDSPYPLQIQHGWRYGHLDAVLIEALLAVLDTHDQAVRERLLARLVSAHGVSEKAKDLLQDGFYLWEPLARFYPETLPYADIQTYAYFRAAWPETTFALVADAGRAIDLILSGRLPRYHRGETAVAIHLNEHFVKSIAWSTGWQTIQLTLPKTYLRRGLNRLQIKWPPLPPFDGKRRIIETLERGETADLYPIFGELYQVIAVATPYAT